MPTNHLLMIRPVNFSFNAETAVNNAFQVKDDSQQTQLLAEKEFDDFVALLRANEIDVTVIDDTPIPYTPDSIFPNNWVSFHADGTVVLYPMFAANRRAERKQHVLDQLYSRFEKKSLLDLSAAENENKFLEGTGSMVLDRKNKIAYACLSPRTDLSVLKRFAEELDYKAISFLALDQQGKEIYHTNVMMCVADRYAVICLDAIRDAEERSLVSGSLRASGKTIISISLDQMNAFAGNMLQVENKAGKSILVMSSQAYQSLRAEQVTNLERFDPILHSSLNTIESNGGGSARCMMAEIYLDPKS